MVTAIPAAVEQQLQQTLAQWRQWQTEVPLPGPPEVIETLSRGAVNSSFLLASETQQQFVLRATHDRQQIHNHSYLVEWRALNNAASDNIAPTPRYLNPELGTLICDYLPPDSPQDYEVEKTGKLLAKIHRLPAVHVRLQLGEAIQRYQHSADKIQRKLPQALARAKSVAPDLLVWIAGNASHPEPPVFCHNDLLRANRLLSKGTLHALDWEYCAMGDRWFDLAAVAAGDKLDRRHRHRLLSAYFEIDSPEDILHRQLEQFMLVYRYLELLWYFNLENEAIRTAAVNESRLTALERDLDRIAETSWGNP